MSEHPMQGLMKTTLESIKDMVDVNTIVGDAVETPTGTVIIPISRVAFGFASGGGEYNKNGEESKEVKREDAKPFAGGAGAGVSVQPVAFLVVGDDDIKLLPVSYNGVADRVIDMFPKIVEDIQGMMSKKNDDNNGVN
jgi:sporulation protein YtfJ